MSHQLPGRFIFDTPPKLKRGDANMKYEIFDESAKGKFRIITFGDLTIEGFSVMLKNLISHPCWNKGIKLLMDHRQSSWKNADVESLEKLADIIISIDKEYGAGRCAIVTPQKEGTAWSVMFKYVIECSPTIGLKTKIFNENEYTDAQDWLK